MNEYIPVAIEKPEEFIDAEGYGGMVPRGGSAVTFGIKGG